ncbi:MAG: M23 family metallopeptidase [Ruminococcaceae bacterium]|nr:M23 family metallopeptidase [Oscillospiraceae bacterium]
MKDKKKLFSSLYSGKGFYITAAVCLCLIAASIGVIYKASKNLITEIAYDTNTSVPFATEQAKADKKDEADPRLTEKNGDEKDTTEATTAEAITDSPSTTKKPPQTTAATTAPEATTTDFGNTSYILPCEDEILKDYSSTPVYDETMDDWRVHRAIDFTCERGTPVYSVGNGIVTKVYADTSYGYCIEIDFGDFIGRYCGLEQGTTVKLDTVMKKGDTVGKTGELPCESGQEPHFHFEVLKDGKNVDPIDEIR